MTGHIDATGALFLTLLRQARPGITHEQAVENGDKYQAALQDSGITDHDFDRWCDRYHGKSLLVLLDRHGKPCGSRTLTHAQAEQYIVDHPNSVVVARWDRTRPDAEILTELRAVFGEPVEGRDYHRMPGSDGEDAP